MPIHLLPPSWRSFCSAAAAQGLQQLLPAAERFDAAPFLVAQQALGQLPQPFRGSSATSFVEHLLGAREMLGEHPVEAVEVTLILHQRQAREVVEILGRQLARVPRFERFEQARNSGSVTGTPPARRS